MSFNRFEFGTSVVLLCGCVEVVHGKIMFYKLKIRALVSVNNNNNNDGAGSFGDPGFVERKSV